MSDTALLSFDVGERRGVASGALAPLARALRDELEPLLHRPLPIPEQKARLTRVGGRCPDDGTLLAFDPWSPNAHTCPRCHKVFVGQAHDDWWAMGAGLWIAERAVQAAALKLLCRDDEAGVLALRILRELAERYTRWPNQDNALGPTRPFFSTYLESIWLLNLCHAVSLLERDVIDGSAAHTLRTVRSQLIEPSRDLIASFHEGRSNRQVWNEVAILAASRTLGDDRAITRRLAASDGLLDLFASGLLDDGTWYEGENYHLFAHRGLWYGVQLLEALGRPLPVALEARYRRGFVTPFLGVLPDDTLPSRRDSQYRVSLRQWRFAEWCELGIAHGEARVRNGAGAEHRGADPRLSGLLARLYDSASLERGLFHRCSTADSERNQPPSALTRADLSWRALLMARAELPDAAEWTPSSVCLPRQGLAVLRRDGGRTYVALEGGHTGGGHGHPDRLALTLQHDATRWLEDPGTGSYVERALHWYRSTLAHAAPLVDGASQERVPAALLAYEERGGAGWMKKRVDGIAPGVRMDRTIVVADGYLVDVVEWHAQRACRIELPLARTAEVLGDIEWTAGDPGGAGGLEDGFDFLRDAVVASRMSLPVALSFAGRPSARAWYDGSGPVSLWRAVAPAPPGQGTAPLHWIRLHGASGCIIGVWTWGDAVSRVALHADGAKPTVAVTTRDGTTAVHAASDTGWHIALQAGAATSSIDLELLQPVDEATRDDGDAPLPQKHAAPRSVPRVVERSDAAAFGAARPAGTLAFGATRLTGALTFGAARLTGALTFDLGSPHYVGTEQDWIAAGRPAATIELGASDTALVIEVHARTGPPVVPRPDEDNVLDNERRDVNADGVQLYLARERGAAWSAAWLAVPAPETLPAARITPLVPGTPGLAATWHATPDGWAMRLALPLASVPTSADRTFALQLIVNERPPERARRRGQLVLSGGGGFGYLRGDRTDPSAALPFRLPAP